MECHGNPQDTVHLPAQRAELCSNFRSDQDMGGVLRWVFDGDALVADLFKKISCEPSGNKDDTVVNNSEFVQGLCRFVQENQVNKDEQSEQRERSWKQFEVKKT